MFGLVVRFRLREDRAEEFDALTARVVAGVTAAEPGTLVYAVHEVEGQPLSRLFYEIYRDREAFEEHERQEHTRRFLAGREACFAAPAEVDFLTLTLDKGVTTGA